MPRVTVASSASNQPKRFETRARTWRELKPEIERQGLSLAGQEAVMRPGNVTLTRDDAELPNEDFRIFLLPTKNKAGSLEEDAQNVGNELARAIIKAANMAGRDRVNELKNRLIEETENFFEVDFEGEFDSDPLDDLDRQSNSLDDDLDPDIAEARRMARN